MPTVLPFDPNELIHFWSERFFLPWSTFGPLGEPPSRTRPGVVLRAADRCCLRHCSGNPFSSHGAVEVSVSR